VADPPHGWSAPRGHPSRRRPEGWTACRADVRSSLAGRSTLSSRLGGGELDRLASRLAPVPGLLAGRRPGLVRADLVPVTILVRERALAAALDFEFVRSADPLFDAAWFRWIVAWHHPRAGPSAWRSFVRASGLDAAEPGNRLLLRTLPLVRLVEILDDEELPDNEVPRWTGMLRACLRWADD
jgi:aminoglycoside phosphotransferase (APT) family kinase protein